MEVTELTPEGTETPSEDEPTYEGALERLESIVKRLESGNLTLDESLSLFEEGSKLTRICQRRLHEAELRIEKLVGEGPDVEEMPGVGLGDEV
jgi:exodeoxyribonuclease VII small subunit